MIARRLHWNEAGGRLVSLIPHNPGDTHAARVSMLVGRVVEQADALEQRFLPDRDQIIEAFRADLSREGDDGR